MATTSEPEIQFQEDLAHEVVPGTPEFDRIIRAASTYASDCINRFLAAGFHVEILLQDGVERRVPGKLALEGDEIIVRPR